LACLVAAFFIRKKIVQWRTITILGFFIDTPEEYYRHPLVYNCISWLLIFILMVMVSSDFSLWIRVVLFLFVVYAGGFEGELKGIKQYRRNLREMLAQDDLDAERKERILLDLSKSDSQLSEERRRMHRLMRGKF
jgi:hypothetical protein